MTLSKSILWSKIRSPFGKRGVHSVHAVQQAARLVINLTPLDLEKDSTQETLLKNACQIIIMKQ